MGKLRTIAAYAVLLIALGFVFIAAFSGCSATRVLVDDCQEVRGTEQKNCRLLREL